jgi:putative ABC transport system permease protein
MLRNFLTIAIRALRRNVSTTTIHILGLALGIATFLLIALYVQHELSYDRFNKKADRIVRVTFRGKMNGGEIKEANVMPPVAATLKADFPEVLDATRLRNTGVHLISYGNKSFREDALAFVDSNFFRMFTLPLLEGDANTALLQPNTIVITRVVAEKYFGKEDPIGKVLQFPDDHAALTVTGLIDSVPDNSHFHFGLFASMTTLPEARQPSWMTSNFFTYLELPEGYDPEKLQAKLPGVVDKYIGPQLQKAMGVSLSQFKTSGNTLSFELQPLTSIHLHSNLNGEIEPNGDVRYVYIFSATALFMLLIACINFINLSTAGAGKRAREVGIRKVLGSVRGQLVGQFLTESLLLTIISTLIAIGLVYWALPFFNRLASQNLTIHWTANPWLVPALLLIIALTGLLAGLYPAFVISAFKPTAVLKGQLTSGKKSAGLRSGLVVFQFFISISLIIGTLVVYRQLAYIQHEKLGYDRNQVLIVQQTYFLGDHQGYFRQQLLQDPRVVSVSSSDYLPAGSTNFNNFLIYSDNNKSELVNTLHYEVDDQYIQTLGMQMAAGRNFSPAFGADSTGIIINETAARNFGWLEPGQSGAAATNKALNHTLTRQDNDGSVITYHVIGVVKDFHFRSFHDLITPLVMTLSGAGSNFIVRTKTADVAGLLTTVKKKWDDLHAEVPLSYSFLDDRFNNTYKNEQNIALILGIFAGLTIFVACLGLFGLATFTAEQRTREIGIRKVLGADITSIVTLLSKDFVRLVVTAFLIAAPIAWWVMNQWLLDFAYRLPISWWIFALAAVLALLISLFTIGYRAIRAASANPTESLRAS